MNAMERAYTLRALANPAKRAEMRVDACARHATYIMQRAREGRYRDMTLDQFLDVLKDHSDLIDYFYDEGGWRTI